MSMSFTRYPANPVRALTIATAGLAAICFAGPAHAGITSVGLYDIAVYNQTGGGAPPSLSGYFFKVDGYTDSNYTSAYFTYPGPGTPQAMQVSSGLLLFEYAPPDTQANNAANFPFGTYTITANNGGSSDSASIVYSQNYFGSSIPALSAASYATLNGLDPSLSLALNFNAFAPTAGTTDDHTFVNIFDSLGNVVFTTALLPSDSSVTIPGGTLALNSSYTYEIDFANRATTVGLDGITRIIASEVETFGTFTTGPTAAPEPAGLMLLGTGLFGLCAIRRRT